MNEFKPTHNWDLNPSRIIPNFIGSTDYIHPCVILRDMIQGKWLFLWTHSNFIGHIDSFQGNHCRRMTKSFTCNCDIFPFFNISRRMYWYCHVSRRYCEDRKHRVRLAILKNWGRWVKFYSFSEVGSNSVYVDKWLLTLIAKCQRLLRGLHIFAVSSLQLWLSIHNGR